jgi:hypothetical protein
MRRQRKPRRARRNYEPAVRYLQLKAMADPNRGASEGERRNAEAAMRRMEEKHGKADLLAKVEAAERRQQPRHSPPPQQQPAGFYGWGSWEEEVERAQEQEEAKVRPKPNAPAGSGYHFKFFEGLQHGYHEVTGDFQYGFVSMDWIERIEKHWPELSKAEIANLIVGETFGLEPDDIAVWEAGSPEPKPTQADIVEEQKRESKRADREIRERKERRARMSPEDLIREIIIEDVLPLDGGELYHTYTSESGEYAEEGIITPRGKQVVEILVDFPLSWVKEIARWVLYRGRIEAALVAFIQKGPDRSSERSQSEANDTREYAKRLGVDLGVLDVFDLLAIAGPRRGRADQSMDPKYAEVKKERRQKKGERKQRHREKKQARAPKKDIPLVDQYRAVDPQWYKNPVMRAAFAKGEPPPTR